MNTNSVDEGDALVSDGWEFHTRLLDAQTIAYDLSRWEQILMRKFTRIYRRKKSSHSWFGGFIKFDRYEYKHVLDKQWTCTDLGESQIFYFR